MPRLLNSPAEVLQWLLVQNALGSDPTPWGSGGGQAWPVFSTNEPSKPDNVITVFDTTPKLDGRIMVTGEMQTHWGVQVRIRSVDHPTGWAKANAIDVFFNETVNNSLVSISGSFYRVRAVTGATILMLGKDAPNTKRSLFTINCMAVIVED